MPPLVSQPIAAESQALHTRPDVLPALEPRPPRWVSDLFGGEMRHLDDRAALQSIARGSVTLHTIRVPHVLGLAPQEFRRRVTDAYVGIRGAVSAGTRTPIRFWNFVPNVGEPMGDGLDRYMVFNAGRYDAFADWFDVGRREAPLLATASAVGINGRDLVIYCLTSETPGTPVENPRQKPAWRYSARYGPMPPCFSRATIATLGGRRQLLIGGTASIVGEDSQHACITSQLDETLLNLTALINAAGGRHEPRALALARLRDLRAYVTDAENAELIGRAIAEDCPGVRHAELVQARICRPELLVEIEGLADLSPER
jgi:chorismate lyase/3-hydroxybenzoate synthase